MRLTRLFVLIVANGCLCLHANGQENYWQQQLKYAIDVTLNDREHTLDGFLTLNYKNNSPDTLYYIWFHVWPNAFKNDKTAFSEQQLQNGKTDFYFSSPDQKGYINRLDFRSGNNSLEVEDHPLYIDIIKVILAVPLLPGNETVISTPFHIKLPYNFSRGGHNGPDGQSYQITQWYPKPAVYDKRGWHPMPYLDQGEFYSEFGSFDVKISLPKNYVVAATGELQDKEEIEWLKTRSFAPEPKLVSPPKKKDIFKKTKPVVARVASDPQNKTLHYIQDNIHDFAIFADKHFIVQSGNIELPSGKKISSFSFYHDTKSEPANEAWKQSLEHIRSAILFRSAQLGDYPYSTISVVEADFGIKGGMEYPTITNLSGGLNEQELIAVIEHEIGHNWFYGALGSNERDFPWLDEGLNSFYDRRYTEESMRASAGKKNSARHKLIKEKAASIILRQLEINKRDQPIATTSSAFTSSNYYLIAYYKTSDWLKLVETRLGKAAFDEAMQSYYEEWKFKHPSPEDFQNVLEKSSGTDLSEYFNLLKTTGPMKPKIKKQKIVPALIYKPDLSDSIRHINFTPVPGYNVADGLMIGVAVHNYSVPVSRFRFIAIPMYATRSGLLNGIGNISYTAKKTNGFIEDIQPGFGFAKFSTISSLDSNNKRISAGFIKFVPSLKLVFRNSSPRSTLSKWLEWKTFIIGESGFEYNEKFTDGNYYPEKTDIRYRYINQVTFNVTDYRTLYPYDAALQLQQAKNFYRVNLNADYFFNYAKGGGMNIRLFAAKFGYIGSTGAASIFETLAYQPKLTAVRGFDDYTYSNYFIGRQQTDGIAAQQIMMRDGGLKIRTDIFQDLQGRSDNWVASMNFNTSIPKSILPLVIPLKIFFDIGTYAEAWDKDANGSRFLYVAGLQLSLFKELLNIYAPIIYSKAFSDNFKTVPEENKFFRKISFSIDVQRFNFRKITGNKFLY